jgi:hypothetical protein
MMAAVNIGALLDVRSPFLSPATVGLGFTPFPLFFRPFVSSWSVTRILPSRQHTSEPLGMAHPKVRRECAPPPNAPLPALTTSIPASPFTST